MNTVVGMQSYLVKPDMMQQFSYDYIFLKTGIVLSPRKMNMFRLVPTWMLKIGLILVFKSNFGDVFMYQHSMNAPDENFA